jgi:hypothetical protein
MSDRQENAIWCEVELGAMTRVAGGLLAHACKCGGSYSADQAELTSALAEDSELLLACDSCSLTILIT